MNIQEYIQYWLDCAEHDLPVAEHLFEKGDYSWSLFIRHIVLEKSIKAFFGVGHRFGHETLSSYQKMFFFSG